MNVAPNTHHEDYAEWLQKRMASGLKRLVFCIGGPYGFSEDVYARANENDFTF